MATNNTQNLLVRFISDAKQLRGDLADVSGKFGSVAGSIGKVAVAANALPAVVTAVKSMSGAVGVLPGVLAAFAAGMATVKIGTRGFTDAVTGTNEELAKLSPNARQAALAVRGLGGAWTGVQKATQDALFKGLASDIKTLGGNYLPVLKTGLSGVAAGLNQGTRETAAYLARSTQVATVSGIFRDVKSATDEVGKSMSPLTQILIDIVSVSSEFLPHLTGGFGDAAERAADFVNAARETGKLREWISSGLSSIGDVAVKLADVWHLLKNIGAIVTGVFQQFTVDGAGVLDVLIAVTDKIRENGDWLIPLIAGLYGFVKVVGLASAAFAVLNVVMKANVVVLIVSAIAAVVVAFVMLWNKSAAFRDFFIGIWRAITDVVSWAWDNVIKPTVDALVEAWNVVSGAVVSAYENGIRPAINAIASVARWLWDSVFKPVIDAIVAAWNFLKPVFELVGAIIGYVFALIAGAAEIMWAVLSGVFEFIKIGFQVLGAIIGFVYTVIIDPIFRLIGLGFQALGWLMELVWNTIIKPVWELIKLAAEALWNYVLKPIFEAIGFGFRVMGDAIAWVYNNVIKPVMGFFTDLFTGAKKIVQDAVDAIKVAWDTIKKVFGSPVKWVVDVIWNKGIVAFWNWIAGAVGLGKLGTIDTSGWPSFADGGPIRGKGGPKSDSILARVSNGEYVMPADKTAQYYPVLEAMRQGSLPGFALGGVVGDVVNWVGDAIGSAINFIKDPVGEFAKAIGINNEWARGVANLPVTMIGDAAKWLWEKIKAFVSPEATADLSTDELASRFRSILTAAIRWTGVGDDWLGPLSVLIRRESNWNPRAQNNWDSNAAKGTPSKGLMQTIDPTFQRHRDPRLPNDPFDPMANIVAGINYIKSRYGSIHNVQQANPNAAPRGYDAGGWLMPGYTLAYNGTGQPEAVMTKQQLARAGGGNTYVFNLTVESAGNSEVDLIDQFNRMAFMAGTSAVVQ
jgi:SLT domain-containing protein/phage-related protein